MKVIVECELLPEQSGNAYARVGYALRTPAPELGGGKGIGDRIVDLYINGKPLYPGVEHKFEDHANGVIATVRVVE